MAMPAIYTDDTPPANSTPLFRPAQPPAPVQSDASNHQETIFGLVKLLLQQNDENSGGRRYSTHTEEPFLDISGGGDHLQAAGAEAFAAFEGRVNSLDKELRNFANAARQLGSCVAILSSSLRFRERLVQILYLFRKNASDLFPNRISHAGLDVSGGIRLDAERNRQRERIAKLKASAAAHITRPVMNSSLELEMFPEQLEAFATDIVVFLNCLNEFPEFIDEAVNASIRSFEGDLKYWASCLKEYSGRFRHQPVQQYIHDLSLEMGEHLDTITQTISMFIEVGVPTIRWTQQHGAANLLNLSTVATLFSAVTATTMQFSYATNGSKVAQMVNLLWFSSMVFSIAAAVNSLMGVTWKQAMYRSPTHRVPWWVLIWIKRSPLVFLVMSVACYSVGLCCFAYASGQPYITSTSTTVFTAFTSFGLTAVSVWFASERYIFIRHQGQKWLSDALVEVMKPPGSQYVVNAFQHLKRRMSWLHQGLLKLSSKLTTTPPRLPEESQDLETGTLPIAHDNNAPPRCSSPVPQSRSGSPEPTAKPGRSRSSTLAVYEEPEVQQPSTGKMLWQNAFRAINSSTGSAFPFRQAREYVRKQTVSSSDLTNGPYDELRRMGSDQVSSVQAIARTRVARMQPMLKQMELMPDIIAHSGLVRDLQFSPDGKRLATASWDGTSVIFHVGDPFIPYRTLGHTRAFVTQVAWSPDGSMLLTKLQKMVKLWTEDGVCKRTIDRGAPIECIAWLPDTSGFVSVEGGCVVKIDLDGRLQDRYCFTSLNLHAIAVTPDSSRLISVGTLRESPTGLRPSRARPEKRLMVYNMSNRQLDNQTPVMNDVRDVSVVQNLRGHTIALISYENQAPPQIWQIQYLKDRDGATKARLALRQTYLPSAKADFAGPSYFGGKFNELVLCLGKGGDIHIWDQESGFLLHHIRPEPSTREVTCLAWNPQSDGPCMFATGNPDGAIRIWATRAAEDSDQLEESTYRRSRSRMHSPIEAISSRPPDLPESSHLLHQQSRPPVLPRIMTDLDEPPASARRSLFREQILAYAAAQRAAEAELAAAQTSDHATNNRQ